MAALALASTPCASRGGARLAVVIKSEVEGGGGEASSDGGTAPMLAVDVCCVFHAQCSLGPGEVTHLLVFGGGTRSRHDDAIPCL